MFGLGYGAFSLLPTLLFLLLAVWRIGAACCGALIDKQYGWQLEDADLWPAFWCLLAGPEYRRAYLQLAKVKHRMVDKQLIRQLEIKTGIVPAPPLWKTIDLEVTKTDHLPHFLITGAVSRNEAVEFLRANQIVQGPWADPCDYSLMRKQFGPERPAHEEVPHYAPTGHEGHKFLGVQVLGCSRCGKAWAIDQQVKVLEGEKRDLERAIRYHAEDREREREMITRHPRLYLEHDHDYHADTRNRRRMERLHAIDKELARLLGLQA